MTPATIPTSSRCCHPPRRLLRRKHLRMMLHPSPPAHGSTTSVGARVRHARFGAGIIASVSGNGQTLELVIDFHGVGHKRLLHRFAQLEAI